MKKIILLAIAGTFFAAASAFGHCGTCGVGDGPHEKAVEKAKSCAVACGETCACTKGDCKGAGCATAEKKCDSCTGDKKCGACEKKGEKSCASGECTKPCCKDKKAKADKAAAEAAAAPAAPAACCASKMGKPA